MIFSRPPSWLSTVLLVALAGGFGSFLTSRETGAPAGNRQRGTRLTRIRTECSADVGQETADTISLDTTDCYAGLVSGPDSPQIKRTASPPVAVLLSSGHLDAQLFPALFFPDIPRLRIPREDIPANPSRAPPSFPR